MSTNNILKMAVRTALFASAVAAASYPAFVAAQDKAQPAELEEIVVTGSLIPLDMSAPGVPISVVSAEDIANSGVSGDVLDVLAKTQPSFYGGLNIGQENGNIQSGSTNGGSQISLRNRSTLVLINGRRATVSPVAASGGFAFVDVNMIPTSAIERIEVLTDGASATYGADAVGGVVNLILKSNFDGVQAGGRYGMDQHGEYEEKSAYATLGTSSENTNVTFSTEWFKSDPLYQADRSWGRGIYRTISFAGAVNTRESTARYFYLNPALNAPPGGGLDLTPEQLVAQGIYQATDTTELPTFFDLAEKPTMLLGKERKSAVLAFDHEVNDNLQVFGDMLVSNTTTTSQLNAQPVSGTVLASHPYNPFNIDMTVRNRFVDFPRIYETDTTGWRGVLGFRGDITGSWKYEIAGDWNYTTSNFRNQNLIDSAAYDAAIADGSYNPFARVQAPGVIEGFGGTQYRDYTSSLYAYDFKVYGDLFALPAGAVQLAVGAATAEEKLTFVNDRNDQTGGWRDATPDQPFAAKAQRQGYYAEMRFPVFSEDFNVPGFYALDVTIAGRQEVYDTTDDDPFVPKFTMRWQPLGETFAVRGSYSESFTAPTLYDLYGPTSQGFTSSTVLAVYDSAGNPTGVNTPARQYRSQSGSNTELDPSKADIYTAGFVWTPDGAMSGFEMSLDYYNIDEQDIVGTAPTSILLQSLEALGPASPYASLVRFGTSVGGELYFGTGTPIAAPGQISSSVNDAVWLSNQNINLGGIKQDGIDLRFAYARDTDVGTFSGQLSGTYLLSYDQKDVPTEPAIDLVGAYHDDYGLFPEYRLYLNLGWQLGAFDVGVNANYLPSMDDITPPGPYPTVDSYNTWDLRVGYDFVETGVLPGLKMAVGVNNVFDEEPVRIESEGNQSYDISNYDPIGQFFYFEASYKF
jgi:iron complex outermembrane receptor protein